PISCANSRNLRRSPQASSSIASRLLTGSPWPAAHARARYFRYCRSLGKGTGNPDERSEIRDGLARGTSDRISLRSSRLRADLQPLPQPARDGEQALVLVAWRDKLDRNRQVVWSGMGRQRHRRHVEHGPELLERRIAGVREAGRGFALHARRYDGVDPIERL